MNKDFKDRNIKEGYEFIDIKAPASKPWDKFLQVSKRTFKGELFVGLWIMLREMLKFNIHTVQYPLEKLPISPRYRAIHKLQRLLYTINFGRCIFCGYCAEVCPELAIVHGQDYEHAGEQRADFATKEDLLTPLDEFKAGKQKEFPGFGSPSKDADKFIKKTPLAY